MIAGKQDIRSLERIGHVIGGVARRGDRLERPSAAVHHLAVGERMVGAEGMIAAGIERIVLADMQGAGGAVRAFAERARAGRRLDARHAGE